MTQPVIAPGATIGILGGGQLGRMLAMAAAQLGYRCHIFDPDPAAPAFDVCAARTVADYGDPEALGRFAASVDVVTFEFENVPVAALARLEAHNPTRPCSRALATAQDRLSEKRFVQAAGLPVSRFAGIASAEDLAAALGDFGPSILKTRRFGYDGKGQVRLAPGDDPAVAWAAIGGQPAILEALVPFDTEVSVIVARGLDGAEVAYGPVENTHRNGILDVSRVPAQVSAAAADAALAHTQTIADQLGYVGVLAVEWFVVGDQVLFNEIAPRVHNSGHWTEAACVVSQFEQHIRAVAGLPLGATGRHSACVMENLIGDDIERIPDLLGEAGVMLNLYGKTETRPGRKMGHFTRLT